MSWSDLSDLHKDLTSALAVYDWNKARDICAALIRRTHVESTPCPEADAKAILAALRKKRRFDLMTSVADAFIASGQDAPRIRRQYAQALVDQGFLLAPEHMLQLLTADSLGGDNEVAEAHGLLGRIYKQRYITIGRPDNRYARTFFERALAEYLQTYRLDPLRYHWHGINAVALLHMARADGIPVHDAPDPEGLAREILRTLGDTSQSPEAFDLATRVEALIAIGDVEAAEDAALLYSRHPDADAFEVNSTLRQLVDVWRLNDESPPGATILPLLRAAKLRGENGSLQVEAALVDVEIAKVQSARSQLERNFGSDKTVTLQWYQTGLLRTKSVARVERLNGKAHGTGWLVRAEDFFPGRPGVLLLTNAHVVNPEGTDSALAPDQAQANFLGAAQVLRFQSSAVWSSPPDQYDATFLAFASDPPPVEPMPLAARKVRLAVPAPLIYIVGHPAGRELELSLHDNKLLGCNDKVLHYRTPTEGGSSGSPVFEEDAWEVVGLHHAGGTFDRLDGGTPPYEANEGISIMALKNVPKT
jgi:Trypsin-like peptidase domain/Tetratricopeptide Repeats-Sensor